MDQLQRRSELNDRLEKILGSDQVHFQPGPSVSMTYPAIVYERDDEYRTHADNLPYHFMMRYSVTVIDRNPDSPVLDQLRMLPLSAFSRHFKADGLNHDVFTIYF